MMHMSHLEVDRELVDVGGMDETKPKKPKKLLPSKLPEEKRWIV